MTTQKPEALWLADELDADFAQWRISNGTRRKAATELRRQHTRIAELQVRIKTMAEEHADELMVAHLDGRMRAAQPAGAQPTTQPAPQPSPAAQGDALSDDAVRVPLDSLHADAAYLIGRLREGSMPYARAIEIIRERIDAAKAAIRARAAQGDALDAARLDWLLLHISGAEFRRIGVHYSGNASRADVDAARKQGANHD